MKCYNCSNEAKDNRTMCESCLKKSTDKENNRRSNNILNNLCVSCGKINPISGKTKCKICIEKSSARENKRNTARLELGLCTRCKRDKGLVKIWHNRYCAGCHLKYKFGWAGTKEEAENIINNLLIKQNFKCALTGRDLSVNKYHIDHIIPKSENYLLFSDPNNWQIIVEEANVFKSKLGMDDLLELVKDMVKEAIRKNQIKKEDINL